MGIYFILFKSANTCLSHGQTGIEKGASLLFFGAKKLNFEGKWICCIFVLFLYFKICLIFFFPFCVIFCENFLNLCIPTTYIFIYNPRNSKGKFLEFQVDYLKFHVELTIIRQKKFN